MHPSVLLSYFFLMQNIALCLPTALCLCHFSMRKSQVKHPKWSFFWYPPGEQVDCSGLSIPFGLDNERESWHRWCIRSFSYNPGSTHGKTTFGLFFTAIQTITCFFCNFYCILKKSLQKQEAEVEMLISVKAFDPILGICVFVFVPQVA